MTLQVGDRVRIKDNYATRTDTPEYQFALYFGGEQFAEGARQAAHDAWAGKTGTVVAIEEGGDPWPYDVQVDGEEGEEPVPASLDELEALTEVNA